MNRRLHWFLRSRKNLRNTLSILCSLMFFYSVKIQCSSYLGSVVLKHSCTIPFQLFLGSLVPIPDFGGHLRFYWRVICISILNEWKCKTILENDTYWIQFKETLSNYSQYLLEYVFFEQICYFTKICKGTSFRFYLRSLQSAISLVAILIKDISLVL